jgi:hypothetical protein
MSTIAGRSLRVAPRIRRSMPELSGKPGFFYLVKEWRNNTEPNQSVNLGEWTVLGQFRKKHHGRCGAAGVLEPE